MAASDRIRERVTHVLVQALGVEEDDVTPSATLHKDLGAESIDLLDIVFRLEREFGIKIPQGELFSESIFEHETDDVPGGQMTEQSLVALRSRMPYADLSSLERDPRPSAITDLFTVDLLVRYVAWKLEAGAAESPGLWATQTDSGPVAAKS